MSDLNALKKRLEIGTATTSNSIITSASSISFLNNSTLQSITSILFKLFIIILIVLIILVVIHFTIKPIFKLEDTPNAPISIPFVTPTPEGELHWSSESSLISENKTILNGQPPYNYTLSIDIYITDPHAIAADNNRILLSRSNKQDIDNSIKNSSLLIHLSENTNDLIITTNTSNSYKENILIKNIPFSKPFKLTVVVGETYMEAYLNGKLYSTKSFSTSPITATGYIVPSKNTNNIQLRNLLLWNKVLSPSQIRSIEPVLSGSSSNINIRSLTNICPSVSDAVDNIMNEVENVPDILDNLINDNNN
jgi:hypothetical protein